MALSSAAAMAPPRIELNLEGMTSAYKLGNSITRSHDLNYVQNDASSVMSRQDWTEKCPAVGHHGKDGAIPHQGNTLIKTTNLNCPFPVAKGYDHQDQDVSVTTRIFLVDVDGNSCTSDCEGSAESFVDFTRRSTYLFKYDASDKAGNHAEQVVFALILDDTEAPLFDNNCEAGKAFQAAITVEAVSDWELCELTAKDNVDATIDATTYKIDFLGRGHGDFADEKDYSVGACNSQITVVQPSASFGDYASAKAYMASTALQQVGKYLVTFKTEDKAAIYGHNAVNNVREIKQAILIRDRVQPTIYLTGHNPQYVECNSEVRSADQTVGGIVYKHRTISETGEWDFEAFPGLESDCRDQLDTETLDRYLPVTTTIKTTAINNVVGDCSSAPFDPNNLKNTHDQPIASALAKCDNNCLAPTDRVLDYTCHDFANNAANSVSRNVQTVDTHAPTLVLVDDKAYDEHANAGGHLEGDHTTTIIYSTLDIVDYTEPDANSVNQIWAEDSCDSTISTSDVTMSWGPRAFNAKILGDYVRTYSVTDAAKNSVQKTRTYSVVDRSKPTIQVLPCTNANSCLVATETHEATRDTEYTDKGATCHDIVDGELSHAVEVSGEVVNLRIPGTYEINYNCQDLSGNAAEQGSRTVVVQDSTDPVLTLSGNEVTYVEAGFPYVDAGAVATDTLDGDITQYIWTDGNTVDTANAFYAMRSCSAIAQAYRNQVNAEDNAKVEQSLNNGRYTITVEQSDGTFHHEMAHCYFESKTSQHTYRIHDVTSPPCSQFGMTKHTSLSSVPASLSTYITSLDSDIVNKIGTLAYYVCAMDSAQEDAAVGQSIRQESGAWTHKAEAGKYIIRFNVEDKKGNTATNVKRTVVVRDTLPPVITLKLNNKVVHHSKYDQTGIYTVNPANIHMANPAGYAQGAGSGVLSGRNTFGNPNFMAESTTTNGWLIGAAASAVAGVALLGLSARKSTVSVPV